MRGAESGGEPAVIVTAQSEPVLSASGAPGRAGPSVQGVPVDGLIAASDRLEGWWTLRYGGWTLLTPVAAASTCRTRARLLPVSVAQPAAQLLRSELVAMRQLAKMRTLNVAICRLRLGGRCRRPVAAAYRARHRLRLPGQAPGIRRTLTGQRAHAARGAPVCAGTLAIRHLPQMRCPPGVSVSRRNASRPSLQGVRLIGPCFCGELLSI